jgi:assimilatory nitrate reductase catalytic subunit
MELQETRSTCPYCGVGCGVVLQTRPDADGLPQITGVRGDPDHPANHGRLCSKGSTLHLTASASIQRQTRLLQPQQRAQRGQPASPCSWDHALTHAAHRLADVVQRHGPDALGFYVSGQLLTEDYYVFNKLVKGLLGTNNIDTNSRLCMSSAVAGYKLTLGADAPPACYEDLEHAGCLFFAGSNAAFAHPVLFRRVEDNRLRRPDMKIVVVDPRRTDTAALADLHLALQPGTDVMLFHGLLHIMLWEGWTDTAYMAAHTTGFGELKALVRDCTPERVARVCGLRQEDLFTAARWFAGVDAAGGHTARSPTLSLYCQGLNQSRQGTAKNAALINLHLATGQIGRAGAGPFSLTGQPNAMGGREVGGLANLLSAHRDLANPAHRAEVAALWGIESVPVQPGKTALEMFQAAADGEIKALWIACTNPAQSLPDQRTVRRALERAEFVVVQEAYASTATCAYADLLLPATTWGEKEGTVTNSERRISRVRAALPAPGEARHDWQIAVDLAQALERHLRPRAATLFPYTTPESVWLEHRASTCGQDLDITGLSYALLEERGPQQWPFPEGQRSGLARLYTDGIFPTADGKARFATQPWEPPAEACSPRFPLALNTGRLRDQWHGMSRTGTLGRLFGHAPAPALLMHEPDMVRRRLHNGQWVHVTSARGTLSVPVQASPEQGPGQVFLPMHWGSEFLSGCHADGTALAGVNALTQPVYCPLSRQPELKHAAVRVEAAQFGWTLVAAAWLPASHLHTARQALSALLPEFNAAYCVPFGQPDSGLLLHAACTEPPAPEVLTRLLERVEVLLGLQGADTLRYRDARLAQWRSVRLGQPGFLGPVLKEPMGAMGAMGSMGPMEAMEATGLGSPLQGFVLAGNTASAGWMQAWLQNRLPLPCAGHRLLLPQTEPPAAAPGAGNVHSASRQVCNCLDVRASAIEATLAQGSASTTPEQQLMLLQRTLGCGTQCGSCVPELRRMIALAVA